MRRGLITGFLAWLAATILFRLGAPVLLSSDQATYAIVYLVGGPLAGVLALVLVRYICEPGKVARFAAGVAIPGLLLDSAAVLNFSLFYPNADPAMAASFGALMLWGYGLIVAAILLFGDRVVRHA